MNRNLGLELTFMAPATTFLSLYKKHGTADAQNPWLNQWVIILFVTVGKILENFCFTFPSVETDVTVYVCQTHWKK